METQNSEDDSIRARILREVVTVPTRNYDPNTWDPFAPVAYPQEPVTNDPEVYETWGRQEFGDDWYELRRKMIRERNIYLRPDPVYRKRQRALRIIEHLAEGRPFEPPWSNHPDWEKVWDRIKDNLPRRLPSPPSPSPSSHNSHSSGFSTFPPTPTTPEPESSVTLNFGSRLEHLEYMATTMKFGNQSYYQYRMIWGEHRDVDARRARLEDEPGNREFQAAKKELERSRKIERPGFSMPLPNPEYGKLWRIFKWREQGWTQEQIDAEVAREEQQSRDAGERYGLEARRRQEQGDRYGWIQVGIFAEPRGPHNQRPPREPSPRPKRQRKVYEKTRSSRRLAGLPPDFEVDADAAVTKQPVKKRQTRKAQTPSKTTAKAGKHLQVGKSAKPTRVEKSTKPTTNSAAKVDESF